MMGGHTMEMKYASLEQALPDVLAEHVKMTVQHGLQFVWLDVRQQDDGVVVIARWRK